MKRWCRLAFWLGLTGACGCHPSVQRVVDGRVESGRAISEAAYAAYFRARALELDGQNDAAVIEYNRAIELDAEAAEPWVRLGRLHCQHRTGDWVGAFAHAQSLDPKHPVLWLAKAECALLRGERERGLTFAEQAFRLDSLSEETNRLLIEAAVTSRHQRRAAEVAWGYAALRPGAHLGWQQLSDLPGISPSERAHALRRLAAVVPNRKALPPLTQTGSVRIPPSTRRALSLVLVERLERALLDGDEAMAIRTAKELGWSWLTLVSRALDMGAVELALPLAQRAHALTPTRYDAWALTLIAADLAGEDGLFTRLLAESPQPTTPLDARTTQELQALSQRRSVQWAPLPVSKTEKEP